MEHSQFTPGNPADNGIIDSPSSIIASIPGTLGYYPQESVVLIGLIADQDDPSAVYLGPLMRIDLPRTSEVSARMPPLAGANCEIFLAVMVTRTPESTCALHAAEVLEGLQTARGEPLIDVCWHVSEIAFGTPYTMVFGPDPAVLREDIPDVDWDRGVVGSVMNSPTMKAMRDNGTLPALAREDTFSYFDRDSDCDDDIATQLSLRALLRADQARREVDTGDHGVAQLIRSAVRALRNAPVHPLVGADKRLALHDVCADKEERDALAAVLTRSMLRDCIIGQAVLSPEKSATALLAVARSFNGIIRANALTIWALIAIDRGLSSWASAALAAAQEEMPEHSMSAICMDILAVGAQRRIVETILQGCDEACRRIVPGLEHIQKEGYDDRASA